MSNATQDKGKLPRLQVTQRNAIEPFTKNGTSLGFTLMDFWKWSVSDLASNTTRGIVAEFLVARAIGADTTGVRDEWGPVDLKHNGISIQVKSAAYLQSWKQDKLSAITFSANPTRKWDPDTNKQEKEARWHADVWVFALLKHEDKHSLDPMDVEQWEFYVAPTSLLKSRTRSQHSITLKSLKELCNPNKNGQQDVRGPITYNSLLHAVECAFADERRMASS